MMHPFRWRDLPTLYRYRHQGLYLNSILLATRGPSLIPLMLFESLNPTNGLITWVCRERENHQPLVGQTICTAAYPSARISFLAPKEALETSATQKLLEQMARQAGKRGAFYLVAEVETGSTFFTVFRKAGFTAYAPQHIWSLEASDQKFSKPSKWNIARPRDLLHVKSLFRKTIPEPLRHIEPLFTAPLQGMVCYQDGHLIGYVELRYGYGGIWMQPYFIPNIEKMDDLLMDLLHSIPDRRSRPVFLRVRAFQSSLAPALEALGGTPSPPQTAMVKHLAAHHKIRETFKLKKIDGRAEPTVPIAHSQHNN